MANELNLEAMTLREKLNMLQEEVVNMYLVELHAGTIDVKDMAPVMTLLSQNKVVAPTDSEESQHAKVKKIVKRQV